MCSGCVYKVCFSHHCHVPCTLVLTACVYVWLSWRCRYISDSGANTDVRNTRDKGLSTCEMLSSEKARQPLLIIIPKCTRSLTEEQMIRNRCNVCTFSSAGNAHVHMLKCTSGQMFASILYV